MKEFDLLPPTVKRAARPEPEPKTRLPWYRDLRFAIGLFAAPFFFFAGQIVPLVAPQLSPEHTKEAVSATVFIAGAVLLFPLATLIEGVTEYYEHNFHHKHDRNSALLRAGLLHTSFTNFAFLLLTIFTLASAATQADPSKLVRIVQVSIAGSIVVSILFNLGLAIFIGGLNFKQHGGRMNFSKELANQDAEMLTIAVIILSLPTLANRLNINPSFLDSLNYTVHGDALRSLSVLISVIMIFIYVSYFLWTLLKVGDVQGETTEDIAEDVLQTLFRAINKVFVTKGEVSLYDALRTPSIRYPDESTRAHDEYEIQRQMDELDASLEADEEEERAHVKQLAEENARREQTHAKGRLSLQTPLQVVLTGIAALFYIVVSPFIALYRLILAPVRWQEARRRRLALVEEAKQVLGDVEQERRKQRKDRLDQELNTLRHEPIWQVLGRIGLLLLGGGGAVFVLDHMANSIESGLVEGFGWNPFFVGFIILPIATGLVDITTAIRKAWRNELQNTLAITAGSAVQSAMLIGPLILILSRLPFIDLPDINLVFGLFILAVFGLIAYFYQIMTVDGETTWFEGAQLLGLFAAVTVVIFSAQP